MTRLLLLVLLLFSQLGVVVVQREPAGAVVTQIIVGGNANPINTGATTLYAFPAGISGTAQNASEASTEAILLAGTLSELRVQLSASVGTATDAARFRVRHCPGSSACTIGTPDDLTCEVLAGTSTCADTTHSINVNEGDRITMEIITTNTPSGVIPSWSFKWVGTNSNESMFITNAFMDAASSGTTDYVMFSGNWAATIGVSAITRLAPPAASNFTLTKLLARNLVDLSATCNRLTLYKSVAGAAFGLDTAFQLDLTGTSSTVSDTGSVTYNTSTTTPDRMTIEVDPAATTCGGTGNGTNGNIAITFAMTNVSQHFQSSRCESQSPSAASAQYQFPTGSGSSWGTEINDDAVTNGFVLKGIAFGGTPAPGTAASGKTYLYRMRDDVADVSPDISCLVTDTETMCGASGSSTILDASLIALQATPTNTPTPPTNWCISWSGTGT